MPRGWADNSNSQLAILALWEAVQDGQYIFGKNFSISNDDLKIRIIGLDLIGKFGGFNGSRLNDLNSQI